MDMEIPRHGGARAGAGRKSKASTPEAIEQANLNARYEEAKTLEMEAKAGLGQLKLEQERGTLVERVAIQAAAATAQQLFVQTARSIPDVLERTYGVAPDVVELVAKAIDEALAKLADDMKSMCEAGQQ